MVTGQNDHFKIIEGIPHLPVVANTGDVILPLAGSMVFSTDDQLPMIYIGDSWKSFCDNAASVITNEGYFRVKNGIPRLPIKETEDVGSPISGSACFTSTEKSLMIYTGNQWVPIDDVENFPEISGSSGAKSGKSVSFKFPILASDPVFAGLKPGAIYINNSDLSVHVYNGSNWMIDICGCLPYADGLNVGGSLNNGSEIICGYSFCDYDGSMEGNSLYQWFRADAVDGTGAEAISGAIQKTYTLTTTDVGKYIGFSVTPVATTGKSPGAEISTISYAGPVSPCPAFVLVHHVAGNISPETIDINYPVVQTNLSGSDKCWISQNLGAIRQPLIDTDNTVATAGWNWQFNKIQGYRHDGTSCIPSNPVITMVLENSDWSALNDPCSSLLGVDWRLPTYTEWYNTDALWSTRLNAFNSVLRLHANGTITTSGTLSARGSSGSYWSSTQTGSVATIYANSLSFMISTCQVSTNSSKDNAVGVRCLRDL